MQGKIEVLVAVKQKEKIFWPSRKTKVTLFFQCNQANVVQSKNAWDRMINERKLHFHD
jgi:hypothetical protein